MLQLMAKQETPISAQQDAQHASVNSRNLLTHIPIVVRVTAGVALTLASARFAVAVPSSLQDGDGELATGAALDSAAAAAGVVYFFNKNVRRRTNEFSRTAARETVEVIKASILEGKESVRKIKSLTNKANTEKSLEEGRTVTILGSEDIDTTSGIPLFEER